MLRKWLFNFTGRLPCRLIHRGQGERYLERYWLAQWGGMTAYLHRFVARDADEWVHDHPWSWSVAIVLTGGYLEERLRWFDPRMGWAKRFRWLRAGRINMIRGGDFHRILEAHPETWTLFIHGRRVKSWGFLKYIKFKHVPHTGVTVYDQPYNVSANGNWQATAPVGRFSDRAPMTESS